MAVDNLGVAQSSPKTTTTVLAKTPHVGWGCATSFSAGLREDGLDEHQLSSAVRTCSIDYRPANPRVAVPTLKAKPQPKARSKSQQKSKRSSQASEESRTRKKRGSALRHCNAAHEALEVVLERATPSLTATTDPFPSLVWDDFEDKGDDFHLQLLLLLQNKIRHPGTDLKTQLLFICSTLALARNYQDFQKSAVRQGGKSEVIKRMASCKSSSSGRCSSDSSHFSQFIASRASNSAEKEVLSAALRFGTKLQVVDAISKSLDLGAGLTLLFGYEYLKLSKLSYRAIAALRQVLGQEEETFAKIKALANQLGVAWTEFVKRFSEVLGRFYLCNNCLSGEERREEESGVGRLEFITEHFQIHLLTRCFYHS